MIVIQCLLLGVMWIQMFVINAPSLTQTQVPEVELELELELEGTLVVKEMTLFYEVLVG